MRQREVAAILISCLFNLIVAMCLAVPGKVIEVRGDKALVDFGGVKREVVLTLLEREVKPGEYVLVHTGYAIQVLDQEEAEETLKLWREIAKAISYEL